MANHIFKNFLKSESIYRQNIEFWKSMIFKLLSVEKITFQNYLTTTKPDGSLYLDGNPIFNFKINNSKRAVRIIQEEPESEGIEFSAWLNSTEFNGEEIDELIISLELTNEAVLLAMELINAWIITELPKQKMEKYINKLFTIKENLFRKEIQKEEFFA